MATGQATSFSPRRVATLAAAIILIGAGLRFAGEAFAVPSASMAPTLVPGDHVIVTPLHSRAPKRGDVVVFRTGSDPETMVKRVIGLPGDSVRVSHGKVFINGTSLPEVYRGRSDLESDTVHVVPRAHFFLLGDNRDHSEDSRSFGFVPKDAILGRARIVYWSISSEQGRKVRWERIFNVIQ